MSDTNQREIWFRAYRKGHFYFGWAPVHWKAFIPFGLAYAGLVVIPAVLDSADIHRMWWFAGTAACLLIYAVFAHKHREIVDLDKK